MARKAYRIQGPDYPVRLDLFMTTVILWVTTSDAASPLPLAVVSPYLGCRALGLVGVGFLITEGQGAHHREKWRAGLLSGC